MPATGTGVAKPSVVSLIWPLFPEKPLPATCVVVEKEKGEWLAVGIARGKIHRAEPQSLVAPKEKSKYGPTTCTSSKMHAPCGLGLPV